MIGSPAIAAFIAFWCFWVLLVIGFVRGEIRLWSTVIFLLLWLLGRVGLSHVPYQPAHDMFTSWVAALDIALVFKIFKGDVRLTLRLASIGTRARPSKTELNSRTSRASSNFLRRMIGSMFMRVNSKCAHHLRPPLSRMKRRLTVCRPSATREDLFRRVRYFVASGFRCVSSLIRCGSRSSTVLTRKRP